MTTIRTRLNRMPTMTPVAHEQARDAKRERRLIESGIWAERLVWQQELLKLTDELTAEGQTRVAKRLFKLVDRTMNGGAK